MSASAIFLVVSFFAAFFVVFFLAQDDTLRLLWDCSNKAHAWDKLFEMVKNDTDTVNVISGDDLVMIQRSMSGSGYWLIMTNTSDQTIAGRTPEETFERYIRGRS